jgi:hypothetical protein
LFQFSSTDADFYLILGLELRRFELSMIQRFW